MIKIIKRMNVWLLAAAIILGIFTVPAVAQAADEPLSFDESKTYAAVSADNGQAINHKAVGWQNPTTVDGVYVEDGKKVGNTALLKITPADDQMNLAADEVKVKLEYVGIEDETYPIRSEGGLEYAFADKDKRADSCEYIVKKTGDNQGTIKDTSRGYYFSIKGEKIERVAEESNAAEFKFVEEPNVTDFTYYIEHKATGKYIKVSEENQPLTVDGEKTGDVIGDELRWNAAWGDYNGRSVAFISKKYPNLSWQGGNVEQVKLINKGSWGGWESIRIVPNGNGTVSFKDTNDGKFFTVRDNKIVKTDSIESSDEGGEFIIHSVLPPEKVVNVSVSKVDNTALTVSWSGVEDTFYTGYKVVATPAESSKETVISAETADTSVRLEGLEAGTEYAITVLTVNAEEPSAISDATTVQTKNGPRPAPVTEVKVSEKDDGIKIEWTPVDGADSYDVYRAVSAYAEYEKIAGEVSDTSYTDNNLNDKGKYYNYYKVVGKNENGDSDLPEVFASLETEKFGSHTLIFAETDDAAKIDKILADLFTEQNNENAQFNGEHWQVYFKPGNYTDTSCMYLGFYTSFNGLGKTPYDVKLNNIAIPAYLPDNNATCNFWRSTENVSVINTGNENGKAGYGSGRPDWFNWAVAQAAPLRRVYSERPAAYDWEYGWASGGYVADCLFVGTEGGNAAGTWSGQQFFTRNSELNGNAFGTTLNNFFMGVKASNLPDSASGQALVRGNGYSNWGIAGEDGGHQVVTNIESTPKISEKPFLYLDDEGEYQVFVPAIRKNTSGISWSKDNMGEGTSVPLSEFYIAAPDDTAAKINEQIDAGKHIYFTPGVYHAEEPIQVDRAGTILLGTGMATIVPDNKEAAIEVADVDGVKVAGLIFDAGAHSEYLLKVGESKAGKDHSANPIVLQDLFFRVGGTTDKLTTADNALEINSDDVLCDHFWIWRADHGAGVAWNGNASQHGLIVNGDDVTCYALFNEHFQNYTTMWNGDNGATYFYQNETAYDPVSQEAWMSHDGTVNGYASYKVADSVENHYAVGLGIYNVFINTGKSRDSKEAEIQLDNAVEVPNKPDVLVENACLQTFANTDAAYQVINSIVNGVGGNVSSGKSIDGSKIGEGWSRKFLISYNNGTAVIGRDTVKVPGAEGFEERPNYISPKDWDKDDRGKFLGLETIENIKEPGDKEVENNTPETGDKQDNHAQNVNGNQNAGSGSNNQSKKPVKTGDTAGAKMLIAVLSMLGAAVVFAGTMKKKRKNSKKFHLL